MTTVEQRVASVVDSEIGSLDEQQGAQAKRTFYQAVTGTVIAALCCFTPILVLTFAALGFSAFTPYLDFVLFPAMAIFSYIAIISWRRWHLTKDD